MTQIDTNIIIRYLTKDDPEKAKRAYSLFQRVAHGKEEIAITEAVITEVIYVYLQNGSTIFPEMLLSRVFCHSFF